MAAIGISEFLKINFTELPFDGEWLASFGKPEKNFKALVYGEPGNGKTEFMVKLTKYLAQFTKVYYNSYEQKFSKSLQDAIRRNNLHEVTGRVIFGDGEPYSKMLHRLSQRNAPGACIIDSRDYMGLTDKQLQYMIEKFPNKIIIVICWEQAQKPKGQHAKSMLFMVDIKIRVVDFRAQMRSRYGGNNDFVIWDKPGSKGAKAPAKTAQSDLFATQLSAEIPTIKP